MPDETKTLVGSTPPIPGDEPGESPGLSPAETDAVRELVAQARASGAAFTGPDGLLKQLTELVVEAALDEEMAEHVGYDKGAPVGRNRGNSRNGKRATTVITDNAGPGADRGAAGPGGHVRAGDRAQAGAGAVGLGRGGAVAVGQGPDPRRNQRPPHRARVFGSSDRRSRGRAGTLPGQLDPFAPSRAAGIKSRAGPPSLWR